MMEKEYLKARVAYNKYCINNEYVIDEKVLKYIEERIKANKEEITKMLDLCDRKIKYEEIEKIVEEEINKKSEYKKQINLKKREDNFVSCIYKTSIGVIGIEAYEIIEVIKYIIRGIKTRNAIIISDIEYKEMDDKNLIIEIVKEALRKFEIDSELIQILPYEECDYKKFDKVIYTYEIKNKKKIEKEESKKVYIYVESEEFEEIAKNEYEEIKKEREVEIIKGKIEEVIEKVNEKVYEGTIIYTNSTKKGFEYINQVRAKNVFVNTTLEYIEEIEKNNDELLMNKKIMYELN